MLPRPISLSNSSSGLDLFSSFTAVLLGEVEGTFNLALNSIPGPRPLWQRWCGWFAFMILLSSTHFFCPERVFAGALLASLAVWVLISHSRLHRVRQSAVPRYPGYHVPVELLPTTCFLHVTAKDREHLNFEQGSILEGCGLCRADDERDFASNLPARQKDSSRSAFRFCIFLLIS